MSRTLILLGVLLALGLFIGNLAALADDSSPTPGQTKTNITDKAEMVWIPAGSFKMGSPETEGGLDEHPQRTIDLPNGFWIYKYDVTVGQYRQYCHETNAKMPPAPKWGWRDTDPIVNVTWADAMAYARWAKASLPSEMQWEKAARGADGLRYPWGDDWDAAKCHNSLNKNSKFPTSQVAPVGSYPEGASPYGVMDMAGNVGQWCVDWWEFTPAYISFPVFGPTNDYKALAAEPLPTPPDVKMLQSEFNKERAESEKQLAQLPADKRTAMQTSIDNQLPKDIMGRLKNIISALLKKDSQIDCTINGLEIAQFYSKDIAKILEEFPLGLNKLGRNREDEILQLVKNHLSLDSLTTAYYYQTSGAGAMMRNTVPSERVVRGGSWFYGDAGNTRCASRIGVNENALGDSIGFRCVVYSMPTYVMKKRNELPTQAEIDAAKQAGTRSALIRTNRGEIEVELYGAEVPMTVANFIKLANAGYYSSLLFHDLQPGVLIQGGDPNGDGTGGPDYKLKLEISAKLRHEQGVLAMAHGDDPDSAGSQFYITLAPLPERDDKYAVFGKVVKGMDVVAKLAKGDRIEDILVK